MLLEFEVRNCSRQCSKTERELQPGDAYFSVLTEEGTELVRTDFCAEAWEGAPEECVGWWRSRVPTKHDNKPKLAPTDVMLNLFGTLADRPEDAGFRYLLGLMLLRKRALRREDSRSDDAGLEMLQLHCPRRNENYQMTVVPLDAEQIETLQQRMIDLLYSENETPDQPETPEAEQPSHA